jgi:hypothetical protein
LTGRQFTTPTYFIMHMSYYWYPPFSFSMHFRYNITTWSANTAFACINRYSRCQIDRRKKCYVAFFEAFKKTSMNQCQWMEVHRPFFDSGEICCSAVSCTERVKLRVWYSRSVVTIFQWTYPTSELPEFKEIRNRIRDE